MRSGEVGQKGDTRKWAARCHGNLGALADEDVPPEFGRGLTRCWSRERDSRYRNESRFALSDEAELLASDALDVLVRVQVPLKRCKPLVSRLQLLNLRSQAPLPLVKLMRSNGTDDAGDEEVGDDEGGHRQDYSSRGNSR